MITHDIDTGDTRTVRAMPRRLLYAVRKEMEEELNWLLDIGCTELICFSLPEEEWVCHSV